jgi:hypothetical protein
MPYLTFTDELVKGAKYPTSRDVIIESLGDSVLIDSDTHYQDFLKKMNDELAEDLNMFMEYMYKLFREEMKKITKKEKGKQRRKNQRLATTTTTSTTTTTTDPKEESTSESD